MFDFVCCEQDSYCLGPRSYIDVSSKLLEQGTRILFSSFLDTYSISDLTEDWLRGKTIFSIVDEPPSCSDTGKPPSKCNIV